MNWTNLDSFSSVKTKTLRFLVGNNENANLRANYEVSNAI